MAERYELRFASPEEFERELSQNLRKGRAFLLGQTGPADRSACEVVVVGPSQGLTVVLAGEVVFAQTEGPYAGLGVDLVDPDLQTRLDSLSPPADEPAEGSPARRSLAPGSERGVSVHERVRQLSPAQRDKLARNGTLAERVALERAFGASVWDALLAGAQITGPEVAKIAKNGTAPATVLVQIASNGGWISKPEVRRALLANPKLPAAQAERILRALPHAELRLVPSQAAYSGSVRALARRLLAP